MASSTLRIDAATPETWWLSKRQDKNAATYNHGEDVARNVLSRARAIETAMTPQRWRSLLFYRHATGRPTSSSFSYGMARRPASFSQYYGGFSFSPPRFNLIRLCSNVYVNRLMRHEIVLSVEPERGDAEQRSLALDFEQYLEAGFDETKFWQHWTRAGHYAVTYGTGFIRFYESDDGCPAVEATHPDEMLPDNPDDDYPDHMLTRIWASRRALLNKYGSDPIKRKAIEDAESAYPAFWFGPGLLDCKDVIPLVYGWKCGDDNRYVEVVGKVALVDKPYEEEDPPFTRIRFEEIDGYYGKGLAETLLTVDDDINEHLAMISHAHYRLAYAKWMVEENSAVNPDALGDTLGAVVTYNQTKPELDAPVTVNPEFYAHLKWLIESGMAQAHISQQAVQGELPKALSSSVALEKYAQISDANFAELGQRLERCAIDSGYQFLRLAKRLKASFTLPGRDRQIIDWKRVEMLAGKPIGLTAFGVNRLSQDEAGKQELIESMLQRGIIDRRLYAKFSQVPDIAGLQDEINADTISVDDALDELLQKGKFCPPTSFMDLTYAKVAVEHRYLLEKQPRRNTPVDRLHLLLMWRAAVMEMLRQQSTPDAPPPGATPPGPMAAAGGAGPIAFGGQAMPASVPNPQPLAPGSSLPGKPLPVTPGPV